MESHRGDSQFVVWEGRKTIIFKSWPYAIDWQFPTVRIVVILID
jgi:hypothetical protein